MLTPARPHKDDPMYQEKMKQYRLDLEDKAANPRNWGIVRGTADDVDAGSQPRRRGRPRKADAE